MERAFRLLGGVAGGGVSAKETDGASPTAVLIQGLFSAGVIGVAGVDVAGAPFIVPVGVFRFDPATSGVAGVAGKTSGGI